jgi:peptidoglycan hydrolase-like protein with peptidoglycan-binding domain
MNEELTFSTAPTSGGYQSESDELEEERGSRSRGFAGGGGARGGSAPAPRRGGGGAPAPRRGGGLPRAGGLPPPRPGSGAPFRGPYPPGRRWRGTPWPFPYAVGAWPDAVSREPDDRERVRWIQACLNRSMGARLRRTGTRNTPTRSLLRSFQRRNGLPATGVISADTMAALRAACGGGAPSRPGAATTTALEPLPVDEPVGDAASAPDAGPGPDAGPADAAPGPEPAGGEPANGAAVAGDGQEEFGDFFNRVGQGVRKAWDKVTDAVGSVADARIIDLTAQADKSLRKGTRDPKKVYALVLHQMACCFAPKDPVKRFLGLNGHFAILSDGRILQLHPVSALLWASNGFNAGSVAVEFAGNFPNTAGKWWEGEKFGRNQVTPAQLDAGRYLIRHLLRTMGLTHVLAHRQSSGTRENDPGPDIWFHVGQFAVENLGAKDGGPGFKIGTGNPIPDAWRNWGRAGVSRETFEQEEAGLDARNEVELGEAGGSHTDVVRPVQRALNQLLGLRLPEDGITGPDTRSAIRNFERQRGLGLGGQVSPRLVASLQQELGAPARYGHWQLQPGAREAELQSETATMRVLNTLPAALGVTWQAMGGLAAAAQQASGPGVYVIFFPRGLPKQAYVGHTKNLAKRLKEHLWCLTHMGLTPASYRVRVAAIDDEKRRKTVEAYINARLIAKGKVTNQKTNELEQELWGGAWQ